MENVYDCYYDYELDKFILKDNEYQRNRNINFLINELRQYANEKNEKDVNEEYTHHLQWEQEDVKILLECIDYLKESSKINLQMAKNNLDKAEHYKTLADIYCLRLENEKQQLISFLEENIRNRLETVEFYENQDIQSTKEELEKTVSRLLAELNTYQEVLDFVNKGGKE